MSERINATRVLTRRRLQEVLLSPGLYVAATIGLLLSYLLVTGFARAIDSSGFDYALDPLYEIIGRSMTGAFGATFVEKLFAEGPFVFALYVGFVPVLLYIAVGSVFRVGLERKIGALELVTYGPADGTSVLLATFITNMVLTGAYLIVMIGYFTVAGVAMNLALGSGLFTTILSVLFVSAAIYGYGMLASTLTDNSASAIALFLGVLVFFAIVIMGSFTIVSEYVRSLSSVFASIVQWVSPLFYWDLATRAAEYQQWLGFAASLLVLAVLAGAVLLAGHFVLRARGVRP